ncbi:MAG TPA: chemotaxis protein CheW [Candidatus Saccharimonadales bacterium]|jgi:two-component system chemotaxis sensor kinase CheA|nr:chemotaxis protein CheW [Candidatus Saccharimonadales bacterium]
MDDLSQYLDLYIQTSKEYIQSLNAALLVLEKNPAEKTAIEDVFRNAHSLKSQSAAMGFEQTGYLCHVVEDVFYEIKQERMSLTAELADRLFAAFDALGASLASIEKEQKEVDLSQYTEALKKLSGVTTSGAGKTQRTDSQAVPADVPAHIPAVPEQTPPAAPKVAINTIAVKVEVLDEMMNLLENLLIEQLSLKHIASKLTEERAADLVNYSNASKKILAGLQYQIMKARAVPVSLVFDHFPRAVRDLARAENKQIELTVTGRDLELDRTIVDRLDEPLIHLLRNAVSHGITGSGTITLAAERIKDYAQISVSDDGQGIDWPQVAAKAGLPEGETNSKLLKEALFSGISTSTEVTQISGRGVGLMAIKKMVDNFGGVIDIRSERGKGTTFAIKLPLTLAIAKALIFTVNQRYFALPTLSIDRIVNVPANTMVKMADQEAFVLDEMDVPLIRLDAKLTPLHGEQPVKPDQSDRQNLLAIIVGEHSERVALVVDSVLDTTDIVIKPVPDALKGITGFTGVTILSDGKTALIINPEELL